jgi:hypothetical protein
MSLEQKHLDIYRSTFIHREDSFALQTSKGSYYRKASPVTDDVISSHLDGSISAGWYALTSDNSLKWVALDADRENGLEQLQQAWRVLDTTGISALLEGSRRGGHLWVLFEPITAKAARRLIFGLLPNLEGVELFPKQDQLTRDVRVGSLMRGPLGIHRLTGKRYPFLDPISLNPISRSVVGSIEHLSQVQTVTPTQVAEGLADILDDLSPLAPEEVVSPAYKARLSPIARLKEQIGDTYSFVSRYVELDAQGKGHCPFHPPDNHPSFAVDRARGFWVCFHETNPKTGRYIGGDAIAFYKRLTGLPYKEVLHQLQTEYGESGRSS